MGVQCIMSNLQKNGSVIYMLNDMQSRQHVLFQERLWYFSRTVSNHILSVLLSIWLRKETVSVQKL